MRRAGFRSAEAPLAQLEARLTMPMFSQRPPSLAHLTDEAATRALSKHFGNIVEAARDLNVDRKTLRRLTWSNPAILDAAHERIDWFIMARRSELMSDLGSKVWRVRHRAANEILANSVLFDHSLHPALSLLAPLARARGPHLVKTAEAEKARVALEHLEYEVAAERAVERERERELEREREIAFERIEVMVGAPPGCADARIDCELVAVAHPSSDARPSFVGSIIRLARRGRC